MTNKRPVQLLVGVASLVTALTLLVGVPLLLVASVGWPLPTSIPSLGAIEQAARSGVDDQVVVNTLAVVAWIAWAQLALAFVVETVTVIRGRPAPHAPFLPGFRIDRGAPRHRNPHARLDRPASPRLRCTRHLPGRADDRSGVPTGPCPISNAEPG